MKLYLCISVMFVATFTLGMLIGVFYLAGSSNVVLLIVLNSVVFSTIFILSYVFKW